MTTVTVWSDIHCPWAAVAVHRMREARHADGASVLFDQRPWPLELVNGQGIPYDIVSVEAAVLANHEPDLFGAFSADSRPSTSMPAFELIAAARRVQGTRAAEDVDYHVRRAFFRDGVDISIRSGLRRVLENAAEAHPHLAVEDILGAWDNEPVRADVLADYRRSTELPIQGSPQVFWPDGTTSHNPGMTDHEWVRGIPRIRTADPEAPLRLLRERAAPATEVSPAPSH
ncbi:DsbA family oxidoreductase [Halostreptopolyspora alba]|uniref:DSBA-like thioredoxin domain-containing protein n=1 Tax=Halostreptopolyspora alba TaxID=2487137 RepID=A0A3N0DYR2_9ACTN|nr:hypothetical protein EFW17_22260 [Nocardiopsaceae bacterium YIM 96095]